MKLSTVNVVEMDNDGVKNVVSFTDDLEGNKEANAYFTNMVYDHAISTPDKTEMTMFIDEGYFEQGLYSASLVHSSME